jgi:predicted DNA-binding protein with PD1-like motif
MKFYIEEKTEDTITCRFYKENEFYYKLKEFCSKNGVDYDRVRMTLFLLKHYNLSLTDLNTRHTRTTNLYMVEDTICEIANIIESYNDSLFYSNSLNCAISIYKRLKLKDRDK